jgi:hypothetical protein
MPDLRPPLAERMHNVCQEPQEEDTGRAVTCALNVMLDSTWFRVYIVWLVPSFIAFNMQLTQVGSFLKVNIFSELLFFGALSIIRYSRN